MAGDAGLLIFIDVNVSHGIMTLTSRVRCGFDLGWKDWFWAGPMGLFFDNLIIKRFSKARRILDF
jgi:hypothetical protein